MEEISLEYKEKISALKNYIAKHYENLNVHAIWLFIATMGAWSINIIYLKLVALAIIFFLFLSKVFENRSDKRPFKKMFVELRAEIEHSALVGDVKKARFFEVDEVEKQLIGIKASVVLAPRFLICYSFWGLSLYHFLMELK